MLDPDGKLEKYTLQTIVTALGVLVVVELINHNRICREMQEKAKAFQSKTKGRLLEMETLGKEIDDVTTEEVLLRSQMNHYFMQSREFGFVQANILDAQLRSIMGHKNHLRQELLLEKAKFEQLWPALKAEMENEKRAMAARENEASKRLALLLFLLVATVLICFQGDRFHNGMILL